MRLKQNMSHGSCQTDRAVTVSPPLVAPVCVRLVMTMLNLIKQRPVTSASLTCCGQHGIIMLGHNMLCVSRVRTDNRTLLCAPPRPWITHSQSQCDC